MFNHRRNVAIHARFDAPNNARCTDPADSRAPYCTRPYCPRHEPTAYAENMARHATDSFGFSGPVQIMTSSAF